MGKFFNVLTFDIFRKTIELPVNRPEPTSIGESAFNVLRHNRDHHRSEIVRLRDEIEYLQLCLEQHEMAETALIKACDAHVIKERLHSGGVITRKKAIEFVNNIAGNRRIPQTDNEGNSKVTMNAIGGLEFPTLEQDLKIDEIFDEQKTDCGTGKTEPRIAEPNERDDSCVRRFKE